MAVSTGNAAGRIFMSYRHEDTAYPAAWLYDQLASHFSSSQVFKDVNSIKLGDDFVEEITTAVGSCDVLLALIGNRWLTITDQDGQRRLDKPGDFVRLEIEAALARDVRVIPILMEGARLPRDAELPANLANLARRQAFELSPSRFDADSQRLLSVLDQTIAERQEQARQEAERAAAQARDQQRVEQLQRRIRERASAQDWKAVVTAGDELAALDPAAADPDGLVGTAREQITRRQEAEPGAAGARHRQLFARLATARRRTVVLLGVLVMLIAGASLYLVFDSTPSQSASVIDEPGGESLAAVAFSPNGKIIATSDDLGNTYLWQASSRKLITALGDPSSEGIRAMAFSPNGTILATADEGGHAYLWDVATHALLATLCVPGSGAVSAVAFSPDGKTLALGAGDDTTRAHAYLWDVVSHLLVRTIAPPNSIVVDSIAFSPNGQILATGADGETYVWAVTSGNPKPIGTLSDPGGAGVMALAFTPDGTTIITADILAKNDAYLWNAATHRLEAELPEPAGTIDVLGAALSPNGKILAIAASHGQYVYDRLWQLANRRLLTTFTGAQDQAAIALAFSPDGKILATGDAGGQIYLRPIG